MPALAGLAVTIAFIPASTWLGKKIGAVRKELVKLTDARVKLCTEVITVSQLMSQLMSHGGHEGKSRVLGGRFSSVVHIPCQAASRVCRAGIYISYI